MKCEKCKCEYVIGISNRFCSTQCAHSFSTLKVNHEQLKLAYCSKCNQEIYIKKNASIKTCLCDNCRNERRLKKCQLCGQLHCSNEFCKIHNIQQIKTLHKYFTFDISCLGNIEKVKIEFNRVKQLLYELYWDKQFTSTEIGKLFNYPSPSNLTNKVFKYLGIPSRDLSESNSLNIKKGTVLCSPIYNNYKCGWHTTWDNKKVYLRSSYEKEFALQLDNKHVHYNVESLRLTYYDTQLNKERIAIPDFIVGNIIYEIKSNWTLNIQNMKDKFNAYIKQGYKPQLILEHKKVNIFEL